MNNFHLYFISSVMFGFPFVLAFGILKIHSITSPLFQKKPKLTDEIQLRHRRTQEIFFTSKACLTRYVCLSPYKVYSFTCYPFYLRYNLEPDQVASSRSRAIEQSMREARLRELCKEISFFQTPEFLPKFKFHSMWRIVVIEEQKEIIFFTRVFSSVLHATELCCRLHRNRNYCFQFLHVL